MLTHLNAALLQVSPTRFIFTPQQKILALSISNQEASPVIIQLQVMQWSQAKGKDIYQPTHDILVTPPIIKMPPHSVQAIRLALRRPFDPHKELTYRLYAQEVYTPHTHPQKDDIYTVLRIGIPIFAKIVSTPTTLSWSGKITKSHQLILNVKNNSNHHIQILKLILNNNDANKPALSQPVFAYILPGQDKQWQLKLPNAIPGTFHLTADTDEGTLSTLLTIKTA